MTDFTQLVQETVRRNHSVDEALRAIFIDYYQIGSIEKQATDAGHNAYALLAVDVSMRLANMFLAIKNPSDHRSYRMACDLTYELATNEFWKRNHNIITPTLHVCLNTYRDGAAMLAEKTARDEYSSSDALISASRAAPLEVFPVIAYLVGGPELMVSASLPLKRALAPYFVN